MAINWIAQTDRLVWLYDDSLRVIISQKLPLNDNVGRFATKILMWPHVIQVRLNIRQCWPVVSTTNCMWGGLGVQQGLSDFTVLSQESIILLMLLLPAVVIVVFLPPTLPPLWMLFIVSICTFFYRGSQCDGAWWVPFTGLSWLPSRLACGPLLFHEAPSPHPSIVDGFKGQ